MKLELEVLASTDIKRKKPWPRIGFLGQTRESLMLFDRQRISVLYLPSGRTKRKLQKLQQLLPDVAAIANSDNGHFLAGLLRTGDLFLWHKDTDMLKYVPGLPEVATSPASSPIGGSTRSKDNPDAGPKISLPPYVCVSDDARQLIVVTPSHHIYIWEVDPHRSVLDPRQELLRGSWSRVFPEDMDMFPRVGCADVSVEAVFCRTQTAGFCCVLSFTFSRGDALLVYTAIVSWYEPHSVLSFRHPTFSVEWRAVWHPLDTLCPHGVVVPCPGAYIPRHSHDGHLLAVAVNQLNTHSNCVLFQSVWTDTAVVADLRGSGARQPATHNASSYWTADLQWTADDLFVVVVTGQGSLCVLGRLGEPLLLQTFGSSMEMGPKPYLPLHPLISIRVSEDPSAPQTVAATLNQHVADLQDPLRQKFSVTTHPYRPIILVSDGYMVTVLQLPGETTCLSLMRGLVSESSRHLRRVIDHQKLKMSLFDSLKQQRKNAETLNGGKKNIVLHRHQGNAEDITHNTSCTVGSQRYQFEVDGGDALNVTNDSDVEDAQGVGDVSVGRIVFGDTDNLNSTLDYRRASQDAGLSVAEHMDRAQRALVLSWALGASHVGIWTADHEDAIQHTAHNMLQLFVTLLHATPDVLKELDSLTDWRPLRLGKVGTHRVRKKKRGLQKVLHLIQTTGELLMLDAEHRHMIVCATEFTHSLLNMLLHNKDLQLKESPSQTLHGCYLLLRALDSVLTRTYSSIPDRNHFNLHTPMPSQRTASPHISPSNNDIFTPAILTSCKTEPPVVFDSPRTPTSDKEDASEISIATLVPETTTILNTPVGVHIIPFKRMRSSWRLLYQQCMQHLAALSRADATEGRKGQKGGRGVHREVTMITQLVVLLQHRLQSMGANITPNCRHKTQPGERLWLEGSPEMAVSSWVQHLTSLPGSSVSGGRGGRLLHTLLYSLLMDGQLQDALLFVELLILQGDMCRAAALCRQSTTAKEDMLALLQKMPSSAPIEPPQLLSITCVRHLVQTLARVMGAYFSNTPMFVYPPHTPRRLPPLHGSKAVDGRVIPLYQADFAAALRHGDLGSVWTAERTLQYLMISGLYTEAVWFVLQLGDWKAAFSLGVATNLHHQIAPLLYRNQPKLSLPAALQPASILQQQLHQIFWPHEENNTKVLVIDESYDVEQLGRTLSDLLLAATMCEVSAAPWLLATLTLRLKHITRSLPPLVPHGVYLPAPPVYCPQPPLTDQTTLSADVLAEIAARREVSSVITLILLTLRASHTALPASAWYSRKVLDAFLKAFSSKKRSTDSAELDIPVLYESFLSAESLFSGRESDSCVHSVLGAFRDLCSVVWMLHARDKLSHSLRHKAAMAKEQVASDGHRERWLRQCRTVLQWVRHLLPFGEFLGGATELLGVLLAAVVELPREANTAKVLAQYCHDMDELDPEIQDKVEWILKEWQGVFLDEPDKCKRKGSEVDSPRGKTLSLCFHRYTQKIEQFYYKKHKVFGHYEEKVFSGFGDFKDEEGPVQNGIMFVGARHFESTEEYLKFLDVFFAVSFSQVVEEEKDREPQSRPLPLLLEYAWQLRERELSSVSHKAATDLLKRQTSVPGRIRITTPHGGSPSLHSPSRVKVTQLGSPVPVSPSKHRGLFRSRSMGELRNAVPLFPGGRRYQRSPSQESLGSNKKHKSRGRSPRGRSKDELALLSHGRRSSAKHRSPSPVLKDRSMSVTDLNVSVKDAPPQSTRENPLLTPAVPPWMLANMEFGNKYEQLEQLMEWLTRWGGRNHTLGLPRKFISPPGPHGDHSKPSPTPHPSSPSKTLMRVRVPPKQVLYSLWLQENVYNHQPQPAEEQIFITAPVTAEYDVADSDKPIEEENLNRNNNANFGIKKKNKKKKKGQPVEEEVIVAAEAASRQETRPMNSIGITPASAVEGRPKPRKLTFHPSTDPVEEDRFTESESTIVVSSLVDEDFKKTMKDTLARMSGTMKLEDLETGLQSAPLIRSGDMNSTLRFPEENTNPSQQPHPAHHDNHHPTQSSVDQGDVADELRSIVRKELRRIIEAQHQGIVTMLGALDDPNHRRNNVTNGSVSNGHVPNGHGNINGLNGQTNECHILTCQTDMEPDLGRRSRSSTDADITPLPSDVFSPPDKPMTVSELRRESPIKNREKCDVLDAGPPKNGGQGAGQGHSGLLAIHNLAPPPQAQAQNGEGKENVVPAPSTLPPFLLRGPGSHMPMSHLQNLLQQFPHPGGSSGQTPFLLRLQPERDYSPAPAAPVYLPQLAPAQPRAAWSEHTQPQHTAPRMPLIDFQPANMDPPPQRDPSSLGPGFFSQGPPPPSSQAQAQPLGQPSRFGIPLLNLHSLSVQGPGVSSFGIQASTAPQLIPAHEIIDYEQQKYQNDQLRKRHEEQRRRAALSGAGPLLKIDMEPFSPSAEVERGSGKRQRRREKKPTDPRQTPRSADTSDASQPLSIFDDGESLPSGVVRVSEQGSRPPSSPVRRQRSPDSAARHARDGEEEEDGKMLHAGHALTPGMFDEYLVDQDELGSAMDTPARIQYRAAMGLKLKAKAVKKDVSTGTAEDVHDRGTSITRDTGTDPVSDAIQKYYRAKTGHTSTILPPDVFLGLRYGDTGSQASNVTGETPGSGHSFINVVDINTDMLDEIVSTVPERSEPAHEREFVDMKGRQVRPSFKDQSSRQQTSEEVPQREPSVERLPGPDATTEKVLGAAAVPGDSGREALQGQQRLRSKDHIRQRLEDMDAQITAIDAMSQNMDKDFEHSRLLVHTIEQMGEAITPADRVHPPASVLDHVSGRPSPSPLTPSQVKRYMQEGKREGKPRASVEWEDGGEGEEDDITPRSRVKHIRDNLGVSEEMDKSGAMTDTQLEVSGLSGVTDILGEVLATGDVDLHGLGLSRRQVDRLTDRALSSARDGVRLSNDELKEIFKQRSPRAQMSKKKERSEQDTKELHDWMGRKKTERGRDYMKQLAEKREAEKQPYTETGRMGTLKLSEMEQMQKQKRDRSKTRQEDNQSRREAMASQLITDLLDDKPHLPSPLPSPRPQKHPPRQAKSAAKPKTRTIIRGRDISPGSPPRRAACGMGTGRSPQRVSYDDMDRTPVAADDYLRDTWGHTDDRLKAYTERLADMDTSGTQRTEPIVSQQPKEHKPLAKMVHLQRPELTRGRTALPRSSYVQAKSEKPAEKPTPGTTPRTPATEREQQRLYGSKHLPGEVKNSQRQTPRVVKPYTERLQEMKQARPRQPFVPPLRENAGARRAQVMRPPRRGLQPFQPRRKKAGKQLTYAQQLQQLQPPKEKHRTGQVNDRTITVRRSHKPAHKPKTYGEQLRELQKSSETVDPYQTYTRERGAGPSRQGARARPYFDPYAPPEDEDERLSEVSPWSAGDEVRRILGNDEDASFLAPTDVDVSDITDMDYLGEDYINAVSVDELADVRSVVSDGSVMSIIDWDQIEMLIADV